MGEVQRDAGAVEALDGLAVELGQQRVVVGRDRVDQVQLQRLGFAEGLRVADGVFGVLGVASADLDIGAQEGGGVVLDLLFEHRVHGGAFKDGVGRAGVGPRRHGGDIGCLKQEEAGRSGATARRLDENDDGHGRGLDGSDHLAGGIEQAAGRAHGDEHGCRIAAGGVVQAALEVLGGDGLDGVVDGELDYQRSGRRLSRERQKQGECGDGEDRGTKHERAPGRLVAAC